MLLISLSLTSLTAHSGPFGLDMGMSLDELSKKMELKPHGNEKQNYVFNATTVPNPHPDFNRYVLVISPEHGLCSIAAVSNPVKTDGGMEVRNRFSDIEEELSAKYGPPKRRESLVSTSRNYVAQDWFLGMQDWLYGMQSNERVYRSRWFDKNLDSFNLKSIQLNAEPSSGNRAASMELIYHFKNLDQCKASQIKNSVL